MVLFQRPFNAGGGVEIAGNEGWVEAISVATTRMKTPDNKHIVVPNGAVYGEAIVNHTTLETRRAEALVGIAYDDIETALQAIDEALDGHEGVLPEPEPRIRASLKQAVEAAGCSIPFPQRDLPVVSDAT